MFRYLSADIICSENRTAVFCKRSSRKTVSFKEQIMSKEKYSSIFLKSNGGYCVYYPLNIFRNTRDLPVCHMSITSKFVNWPPKSPRLSKFRFLFSQKRIFGRKVQHLPERKKINKFRERERQHTIGG